MVVVVMMVVVMVNHYNHLCLRSIRRCEAEGENECKPKFFHTLSVVHCMIPD